MANLKKYPLLLLFTAFMLVLSLIDPLFSSRAESEMENRKLAQRPQMTLQSLLAREETQKYSYRYEQYVNDQFVGRDAWITLKSVSESALGKIENNGIVYGDHHRMFEYYPSADQRRLSMNVEFLTRFAQTWQDTLPLSVALVPSSYMVYVDDLPAGLPNLDQQAAIQGIYSQFSSRVNTLDLLPMLEGQAEGEDLYYKTDHHWTTWGAYQTYRAFAESRGLQAVSWEELAPLERQVEDFYGTYYSKCKLFSAQPDTITYFDIPTTSVTVAGEPREGLYDASKWPVRDKYAAFLWGNNDLMVIRSDNNLNHRAGETSRILVVKDSYGNSLIPFLTYSYDEIYVVDLRFLTQSMTELVSSTQFDDLLILYSFMNFASDSNLTYLNR